MNPIKKKFMLLCSLLILTTAGVIWLLPTSAHANPITAPTKPSKSQPYQPQGDSAAEASGASCGQDAKCKKIYKYLYSAADLISALVGVVAVAMIIYGGIEFSSSGGDPQKVASGKNHITNAIIALVAFLFLWAFLNFIIPGGLFNGGSS